MRTAINPISVIGVRVEFFVPAMQGEILDAGLSGATSLAEQAFAEYWPKLRKFPSCVALPMALPLVAQRDSEEASARGTGWPTAAEIAKQVYKLLARDPTLMLRPGAVAAVPAHTVDQRTACKIIKASDSTLRRGGYFSNLAAAQHDPAKLNGVLVGREWRFEVSEVYRFADFYWGQKKAPAEGAGPAIRGRDV